MALRLSIVILAQAMATDLSTGDVDVSSAALQHSALEADGECLLGDTCSLNAVQHRAKSILAQELTANTSEGHAEYPYADCCNGCTSAGYQFCNPQDGDCHHHVYKSFYLHCNAPKGQTSCEEQLDWIGGGGGKPVYGCADGKCIARDDCDEMCAHSTPAPLVFCEGGQTGECVGKGSDERGIGFGTCFCAEDSSGVCN